MTLNHDTITDKAEEYYQIASDDIYLEEEPKQLERLPLLFENRLWEWDDLEWIVRWKFQPLLGKFRDNDRDTVDRVIKQTLEAHSTATKIDTLRELNGVRTSVASSFLLFMDPQRYTVIDDHATTVLYEQGYLDEAISENPPTDSYIEYLSVCQQLADQHGVDLRTLDRALWVLGGAD